MVTKNKKLDNFMMVRVPTGTFKMGSSFVENKRHLKKFSCTEDMWYNKIYIIYGIGHLIYDIWYIMLRCFAWPCSWGIEAPAGAPALAPPWPFPGLARGMCDALGPEPVFVGDTVGGAS